MSGDGHEVPAGGKTSSSTMQALSEAVRRVADLEVYPESFCAGRDVLYAMGHREGLKQVLRLGRDGSGREVEICGDTLRLEILPCDHETALRLREEAEFFRPRLGGARTSIGMGDRLGLATPGHVRAVRKTTVFPYLAQQSIREMERTQRTPDDVMDCATFGVLQCGWVEGFGSDADHLKEPEHVDRTMDAGFTMFTVDPGDHVVNEADTMDESALKAAFAALAWEDLQSDAADTRQRYAGRTPDVDLADRVLDEEKLLRAAVKYGGAIAHTARMYRHIRSRAGKRPVEVEVSVDETDSPTSPLEHYFIASELTRLGVSWVSLAPRFVGRFEKGVDYIGDLAVFEAAYREHCLVAEAFGAYKISIHSGSDKFSIYEICSRHAKGRVHLKTAGTSYLEALRAIATVRPELFREILAFARERYEEDKASYHVSADLAKVARPEALKPEEAPQVLDQFDTREALHVTFGSVLTAEDGKRFKPRMLDVLRANEEAHFEILRRHLGRHIQPLIQD